MALTRYVAGGWLEYRIYLSNGVEILDDLTSKGALGDFLYEFKGTKALFRPQMQHATLEEARAALEPLLEAWCINALLDTHHKISIAYVDHEVEQVSEDLILPRPNPPTDLRIISYLDSYPEVPEWLNIDECTRDLARQYERAIGDSRVFLMFAYAMVTRVEFEYASLPNAAKALALAQDILKWMKIIATERTTENQARKYKRGLKTIPLGPEERNDICWLMRELVIRCARISSGKSPGKLLRLGTKGHISDTLHAKHKRS